MDRDPDIFIPYRLRTVRLGVQATAMVLVALPLLIIMPARRGLDAVAFFTIVSVAAAGAIVVWRLPWPRLFARGLGVPAMYVWSGLDIVLITLLHGVVGPDSVDVFLIYALTTIFFAASYPPKGQIALLGLTYFSYLTLLALTGWTVPLGNVVTRFGILGTMTFLAGFLSKELMGQTRALHASRDELERRAGLLRTVAGAARTMSSLDPERVLASVVDAAVALGFEAAEICFYDEATQTYRVGHPRGLPAGYATRPHSASTGIVARVLRERTSVVTRGRDGPGGLAWIDDGFLAVIATPVWSKERVAAVMIAGTRRRVKISDLEREAFELLAGHAGRALENAERFAAERHAVERMAELDRMKQDFLSSVSHEIRTPLTVIEGNGLTMEQHWDRLDEGTLREFLASMNANAKSLDGIVSKLLDFSRLESGRLEVHIDAVPALRALERAAGRLSGLATEHMVLVEGDAEVTVRADPLLLDRILENLVSNAVKYTPPGTGVLLSVQPSGGDVVFAVTDHGPGMPEAEVARLGERFFRGGDPNNRAAKGIGLGLALAREFLQLHGSDLEVESTLGRGSRFWFRLPLIRSGRPTAETHDLA